MSTTNKPGNRETVTHNAIMAVINEGQVRMAGIEEQLTAIAEKLEVLPEMQRDIAETKEIVEAWAAIKTMGKFVKWTGSILAALAGIFAAMKIAAMQMMGRF